jgi:hypothetical protein
MEPTEKSTTLLEIMFGFRMFMPLDDEPALCSSLPRIDPNVFEECIISKGS